ncbi:MAG: TauD/TfdA family dioxygenase, partial [Kiloniellales bacterium]|nr:TauD/TfdA family dioxygenase [Kiloniellales bacterium]
MVEISTPDHLVWETPAEAKEVHIDDGHVTVVREHGSSHRFQPFRLRENSASPSCLHQTTREQLLDICELPMEILGTLARIDDDGAVSVTFSDAHESRFHPGWLWAHRGGENWPFAPLPPTLWIEEDLREPPSFDGPSARSNDAVLSEVLAALERYGIVRLRGLPTKPGTVEDFALSIGPVRETQFERVFNVISRADADSNAYTSGALSGHVDLPTWEATPGIQILHCLENSAAGGESPRCGPSPALRRPA